MTRPPTITILRAEYDRLTALHYRVMDLESRPASARDIDRADKMRRSLGLTSLSIPPKASIGEIERIVDTMLAFSSSQEGVA